MIITEVCAAGYNAALAAAEAGAHRIELCENLESGGLTPSYGTLMAVKEMITCPVHVLIRPRRGDYVYDRNWINIMIRDIQMVKSMGFQGIVIGALTNDGNIHTDGIKAMTAVAEGMQLTFHRAIDVMPDPLQAIDQLVVMGFHRVLTSGGAPTAWEGRSVIRKMQQRAGNNLQIMAGSGINSSNVAELIQETQLTQIHLSAKSVLNSQYLQRMPYEMRPALVGSSDWWHYGVDVNELKKVLAITKKAGIASETGSNS